MIQSEKAHIAAKVVQQIRTMEPNGRFLKEEKDGAWYDIGDQKAIKKVGQALREDAIEVRQEIGSDEEGEGGPSPVKSAKSPSSTQAVAQVETFETLASQDIAPPPAYQSMPPPTAHFGHGGGHVPHLSSLLPGMPAGTQVSSAAAAVMQEKEEDDNFDEAFGKTFVHPPLGVETHREVSLISGLSGPTSDVMSGISFVSEKSAQPLRTSHNHYYPPPRSSMQSSFTPSDATGTRNFLTNSTNLGSSLGRSNSLTDVNGPDNMSVAENSLTGGGLRESANQYMAGSVHGMASITGSNLSSEQYRERGGYRPPRHTGQSHRQPYAQYAAPPMAPTSDLASVTSMSIGESILSGLSLSESLNALDLADSSRL